MMNTKELSIMACDLRKQIVDIIVAGKGGHIGGDMSVLEILLELYMNQMNIDPADAENERRDRFVMSKGHCVEAYYAVLAARGFLDMNTVKQEFNRFGTAYIGHPNNKLPGIEMNTGSLGHGLPVCVGMALAAKMDGKPYRVYTVMGDGELAEGSVWEGAMAASHFGLDNLCAVIDRNRLQISGGTEEVMAQESPHRRLASFGWHVIDVADGNDPAALHEAFAEARAIQGSPVVLIANTVKGKGSTVTENKASWHHRVPNGEEYRRIMQDLDARKEALQNEYNS